jgi:hypothetical protein
MFHGGSLLDLFRLNQVRFHISALPYRRPPYPELEVPFWHLKMTASSAVS